MSIDPIFSNSLGKGFYSNGKISSILEQTDGSIIICGSFTAISDNKGNIFFASGLCRMLQGKDGGLYFDTKAIKNKNFGFSGKLINYLNYVGFIKAILWPDNSSIIVSGFFDTFTDSNGEKHSCNNFAKLILNEESILFDKDFTGGYENFGFDGGVSSFAIQNDKLLF